MLLGYRKENGTASMFYKCNHNTFKGTWQDSPVNCF